MENGGEGKSNVRKREGESCSEIGLSEERESCFLGFNKRVFSFLLFYLSNATCLHLSGAKRAYFPFLL